VLLLLLFHKVHPLFQLVAYTGVIKYGFWAMLVLSGHWLTGGEVHFIDVMLWLSHLGMAVEGLILIRVLSFSKLLAGIIWGWLYLNDFMDYYVGLHPYLPNYDHWTAVMLTTISMSTLIGLYIWKKGQKGINLASY
ncbi:MAG: DUF1405 domain-containing protein, partial [Bacillota bacterium]|nr:DUF1405 domain-containing protein [Bacillota bacterium]